MLNNQSKEKLDSDDAIQQTIIGYRKNVQKDLLKQLPLALPKQFKEYRVFRSPPNREDDKVTRLFVMLMFIVIQKKHTRYLASKDTTYFNQLQECLIGWATEYQKIRNKTYTENVTKILQKVKEPQVTTTSRRDILLVLEEAVGSLEYLENLLRMTYKKNMQDKIQSLLAQKASYPERAKHIVGLFVDVFSQVIQLFEIGSEKTPKSVSDDTLYIGYIQNTFYSLYTDTLKPPIKIISRTKTNTQGNESLESNMNSVNADKILELQKSNLKPQHSQLNSSQKKTSLNPAVTINKLSQEKYFCSNCKFQIELEYDSRNPPTIKKCLNCKKYVCLMHKMLAEDCFCICVKCRKRTFRNEKRGLNTCTFCGVQKCISCKKEIGQCNCRCKFCLDKDINDPTANRHKCPLMKKCHLCLGEFKDMLDCECGRKVCRSCGLGPITLYSPKDRFICSQR